MPGILSGFTFDGGGGGGGGGPLSLYLSPADPINIYNPLPSGSSNRKVTAVASGGTPPYTYLWTRLSSPDGITGLNTTTYQATFTALGNGSPINTDYEQWECEVTDAVMATVAVNFWIQFIFGAEEP